MKKMFKCHSHVASGILEMSQNKIKQKQFDITQMRTYDRYICLNFVAIAVNLNGRFRKFIFISFEMIYFEFLLMVDYKK